MDDIFREGGKWRGSSWAEKSSRTAVWKEKKDHSRREGQDESGKVRGNQQRRVQKGPGNSNRVCRQHGYTMERWNKKVHYLKYNLGAYISQFKNRCVWKTCAYDLGSKEF